jgi:signal transduction histidine kinase
MESLPPSDYVTSRTPLTLINAPIRDLLRDVKDPKQREKLNLAARNSDRLSRLVDSLMDFSRLEAGRFEGMLDLPYYQVAIDHFIRSFLSDDTRSFRGRPRCALPSNDRKIKDSGSLRLGEVRATGLMIPFSLPFVSIKTRNVSYSSTQT